MRYPDTSFMKRTFDLARNRLGLADKVLPYIRDNDNTFRSYNGHSVTKAKENSTPSKDDIFMVSESNAGHVPDKYVAEGSGVFWDNILDELRQLFVKFPFDEAFKKLKEFDGHSVTSYLIFEKKLPYEVIKWYETMESRTGLFDASLTETVLASLVFKNPRVTETKWYYFEYVMLFHFVVTFR